MGERTTQDELLKVSVAPTHSHGVEIAVVDETLDSDGLMMAASIDIVVNVVEGVALINGKYALPVGLSTVEMKASVNKYHLKGPYARHCHTTLHDVEVVLSARVTEAAADPNTMDVVLQVTEYDGASRELVHATLVSVMLDEGKRQEHSRNVHKTGPLTHEEKAVAAGHKVAGKAQATDHKVVEAWKRAGDKARHVAAAAKEDARASTRWLAQTWRRASPMGKAGMVVLLVAASLGAFSLVFTVVHTCCGAPSRPTKARVCYMKTRSSQGPRLVTDKYKGVKYTPVQSAA